MQKRRYRIQPLENVRHAPESAPEPSNRLTNPKPLQLTHKQPASSRS